MCSEDWVLTLQEGKARLLLVYSDQQPACERKLEKTDQKRGNLTNNGKKIIMNFEIEYCKIIEASAK